MPANPPPETALALVHRGWEHLRLQRPLAAWASWQQALRVEPDDPAATEALAILESAADLPASARVANRFRSPSEADRARWSSLFAGRDLRDLTVAAGAFAELADDVADDAASAFNQALCHAWMGENATALVALDRAVAREAVRDPESAVASWRLAEVLRQGAGAEAWADDLSYALAVPWYDSDGDPIARVSSLAAALRAVPVPIDPSTGAPPLDAVRVVEWLDRPPPVEARAGADLPRVLATVVAAPGLLRLSSPDLPSLARAESALLASLGDDREVDRRTTPLPLRLMDAATWLHRLPDGLDEGAAAPLRRSAVESEFEHNWIRRPRHGLAASPSSTVPLAPLDASRLAEAGDVVLRCKLRAVIDVREQLSLRPRVVRMYEGYPFDRLRRRLGLEPNNASAFEPGDVTCMGERELEGLDLASLDRSALHDAVAAARDVCRPEVVEGMEAALRAATTGDFAS